MVVLVTGGSGQLGQALQKLAGQYPQLQFYFAGSDEANVTDKTQLHDLFAQIQPDYCINAAAYTAVDLSEKEPEAARGINVVGAKNLAEICHDFGVKLLHISTDFVFDGYKSTPYTEDDATNPQGVYGQTKCDGEVEIRKALKEHFIVRTSWLYSEFGNNFMKTMLRLAGEPKPIKVVNDQIGTPTNANDLAHALVSIILSKKDAYGTYHFSNEGAASWYDFAKEIFSVSGVEPKLLPASTTDVIRDAKRPPYSVLDKSKIKNTFGIRIDDWKTALKNHAQ